MVAACVCLHNYFINNRITNDWLMDEAPNMDNPKVNNEGERYDFVLASSDSRDKCCQQACIDMLERIGHI